MDHLLTVEEVAERTGLSVHTLNQWRSQEKGPPYLKIGGKLVRYRKADLIQYFDECRVDVSNRRHQ